MPLNIEANDCEGVTSNQPLDLDNKIFPIVLVKLRLIVLANPSVISANFQSVQDNLKIR